jgi:hypothetical protein
VTAAQAGRRAFLAGAVAVPATAALPAPKSSDDRIRAAADALAAAMQARHGGRWIAVVDHDPGFILIHPPMTRAQIGGAA